MDKNIKLYKKTFEIGSCALTSKLAVNPSDMLVIMQEAAIIHSDELGYPLGMLKEAQKGWAIKTWNARFYRLPNWREKITVETWTGAYKKLLCGRSFLITDENGQRIAEVDSKWVFMDIRRRRPIKPDDNMLMSYVSDGENILPEINMAGFSAEGMEKLGGSVIKVMRSHTDTNLHVNNTTYVRWAEDDLPDDIYYNKWISGVFVNYRKECKQGITVETACYKTGENEYTNIIKNDAGEILAEIIIDVNEV